jgi:predicted membrane channel-forming protein YqfA (hemolysin III family)
VAWSSWAAYQALSEEVDGLVRLVGIYEGIVIGIPTVIIAFDQLKLTDRWTGRLLRLSLLVAVGLPVLLPWYFLPPSLLARIFGLDLAPVAAVLLLATAAPVGSLLMPAAAVLLPLAPQVKRIAALAIWSLGILDTLFVMSATPASAYREVWLVASVALATVYLAVAFRVARLIPKR